MTLHDRRKYKAKVVGQASSTDLALLKIEEEGLQSIQFANSSQVEIGEWVVAVGNPFNLNSTVTAGIVSAKGRNLQVMNDKWQISSFIQTDAAVNPGNSGGALVDLNGNLIGINTAIASPTGAYAGYAFAIPSNLVKKVVTDLKKYGTVQRGYLGVQISNLNNQLSKKLNIERPKGVYIADVMEESAATGKLKKKDVIIAINDKKVENASKLQQLVALHRPGDEITITFIRDGKKQKTTVTLKNREGTTTLVKKTQDQLLKKLGVQLKDLTEEQQEKLNINGGVKITEVTHGIIPQSTNVRKNFIITKVNNKPVFSVQDVLQALKPKFQDNQKQGILLEGIYPERSGIYYYGFRL